jgi:hypothetical protein
LCTPITRAPERESHRGTVYATSGGHRAQEGGLAAAATHTTGFPATAQLLSQGTAILILTACTAAALLAGATLLRHRDITA